MKAWCTLLLVAACAAAPYFLPALTRFRPLDFEAARQVFAGPWRGRPRSNLLEWRENLPLRAPRVRPVSALWGESAPPPLPPPSDLDSAHPLAAPPSILPPGFAPPPGAIEDYGGGMARFFAALLRTANREPGAVTRIAHFGDSPLTGDLISGEARARLQQVYGDAGHGFVLAGKPWEWYGHLGVTLESSGWRIYSPFLVPSSLGPVGLGLAGFASASPGARTIISTAKRGPGSSASKFEVHCLARLTGGTILASLEDGVPVEISTAAPLPQVRVRQLSAPDGPHRLTLRPKGDGEVVLFGAVLEREGPGVVYDALGANGASVLGLTRAEEGPWVENLSLRRPDLVVLQYGTNESGYAGTYSGSYRAGYREVLRRVRRALPDASILVMAPMDRGERDALGEIVTVPGIPRIVEAQRTIARECGCAFFDTFQAMGGEGTMGRWYRRVNPLVSGDLTHPSRAGSDIVARLLVDALDGAFHAWISGTAPRPALPLAEGPNSEVPSDLESPGP